MIVKTTSVSYEATHRFLKQRHWNVQVVTGSIQKGLQVASAFNPKYVFMSVESLPNNYRDLYSALKKSYQLVLFSEKPGAKALRFLHEVGGASVILTPLTGPTIE